MSHSSYLKRAISLLLVCGVLCSLMVFPSAQAADPQPEPGEWLYSQLSPANQEAYSAIHQQVEELAQNSTDPSTVSFTPTLGDPTGAAIFAFFRDHPEYFWVDASKLAWNVASDGQWSLSSKITGESFFCEGFHVDTLSDVRKEFDKTVEGVLQGMPSGDRVTQLRYLNNWISQHNVYNPLGVGASNYSRCAASGILSNNQEDTAPVCYGYAAAFKVLLDKAGIPNAYIEGWAYNQSNWPNGEQHAWNYVQVDGSWYAIDPTWDDPKLVTGPARFHYFLVGSETVTETSLNGKGQFGQNHDVTKSPANSWALSYPPLSKTASNQVVTTGFELIQEGNSTRYDTLEEALSAAQKGSTVKLWQPATITQTLTIPDGVTLDVNGQNSSGTSLNAVAISGSITPLLQIESGSQASIVNSGLFTAISTSNTGVCIQNDGRLDLGTNMKVASEKSLMGGSSLTSPIGGNQPQYPSNSYAALNSTSPHLLFVYLVVQPTISSTGTYQANGGETVQHLMDGLRGSLPSLTLQYYGPTGALLGVPSHAVPSYTWNVGRSPNDGNHITPEAPLENGDYLFVTTVFGYPVTYTVTVSGVPDAPKQYTVTVHGGDGATGAGIYQEGAQVTVTAGSKAGHIFGNWTANGISLTDDTQPQFTFTMPDHNVTLTANFVQDITIQITGATLEPKTYDGTTVATVTGVDFEGLASGEQLTIGTDYTATAVFDSADAGAGNKTATVTVTLKETSDYSFTGGTKTAVYALSGQSIAKVDYDGTKTAVGYILANTAGEVELPQLPDGATYGNPISSGGSDTIGNMNIVGNKLSYTGGSGISNGQTYTITVPVNGGGNYHDYQITVTLTAQSRPSYFVTVNGGTGGGWYQVGDTVSISATVPEGMAFTGWSGNVTFGDPTAVSTTFTMPAQAVTVTAKFQSNSTGGGSTGGGSSSGDKTETVTNPDGSTTTTVTKPDGSTIETTQWPDGSKEVIETAKDGTVTTTTTDKAGNKTQVVENPDGSKQTAIDHNNGSSSVTMVDENGEIISRATLSKDAVEEAQTAGEAVQVPIPQLPVTTNRDSAPTVTVDLPVGGSVEVEIPVEDVTPGTVAVIVKPDGTEEVVKTSLTTENGVTVTLSDGDTVKIVDNSKTFTDVSAGHWSTDAVAFATSRELFGGTSATTFSPNIAMTRAMFVTVMARLEGVNTNTGSTWYEDGWQWAIENGISDGTHMEQSVTREQLATMLYRYAQRNGYDTTHDDTLMRQYGDVEQISGYAKEAMVWAVNVGIIAGTSSTTLSPKDPATRAQAAAFLMRFCENVG